MRVFVAGASGAIGTRLVPQLIDRGHEVIGTFRSPEHAERVRALGAEALPLDLLDRRAVRKAVLETEPEAIVHQATALANAKWGRNFDKVFARTNELRTTGTDALLAAGAFAVESADDVLAALDGERRTRNQPAGDLAVALAVLPCEKDAPALSAAEVAKRSGLQETKAHAALLRLTLMGYVARLPGERYKSLEKVA
jgi:NAD(P)-dependent dehydrogenase (short-subunit alcohol dehydrogenase family)